MDKEISRQIRQALKNGIECIYRQMKQQIHNAQKWDEELSNLSTQVPESVSIGNISELIKVFELFTNRNKLSTLDWTNLTLLFNKPEAKNYILQSDYIKTCIQKARKAITQITISEGFHCPNHKRVKLSKICLRSNCSNHLFCAQCQEHTDHYGDVVNIDELKSLKIDLVDPTVRNNEIIQFIDEFEKEFVNKVRLLRKQLNLQTIEWVQQEFFAQLKQYNSHFQKQLDGLIKIIIEQQATSQQFEELKVYRDLNDLLKQERKIFEVQLQTVPNILHTHDLQGKDQAELNLINLEYLGNADQKFDPKKLQLKGCQSPLIHISAPLDNSQEVSQQQQGNCDEYFEEILLLMTLCMYNLEYGGLQINLNKIIHKLSRGFTIQGISNNILVQIKNLKKSEISNVELRNAFLNLCFCFNILSNLDLRDEGNLRKIEQMEKIQETIKIFINTHQFADIQVLDDFRLIISWFLRQNKQLEQNEVLIMFLNETIGLLRKKQTTYKQQYHTEISKIKQQCALQQKAHPKVSIKELISMTYHQLVNNITIKVYSELERLSLQPQLPEIVQLLQQLIQQIQSKDLKEQLHDYIRYINQDSKEIKFAKRFSKLQDCQLFQEIDQEVSTESKILAKQYYHACLSYLQNGDTLNLLKLSNKIQISEFRMSISNEIRALQQKYSELSNEYSILSEGISFAKYGENYIKVLEEVI